MSILLIFFLLLLGSILAYFIKCEIYVLSVMKNFKNVEKMPYLPVMGFTHLCIQKTFDEIMSIIMRYLNNCEKPVIGWILYKLTAFIASPDDIQIVLNSPDCLQKSYHYDFFPNSTGIFNSPPEEWKVHRKLLNPTFNPKILNSYREILDEKVDVLIKQLKSTINGRYDTDIYPYVFTFSMELTLNTVCSYKISLQEDKANWKYYIAFENLTEILVKRLTYFWLHPDFIFHRTKAYKELHENTETFFGFLRNVMNEKENEIKRCKISGEKPFTKENGEIVWDERQLTTINKLFKLQDEGVFSKEDVYHELTSIFFGGLETSASVITSTVLLLATHPDVQDRLVEEIISVYGTDPNVNVDPSLKLTYLDMVIKEAMRLFPIGPLIGRTCKKDIKLKSCTVPAGNSISIAIYSVQRHEQIWGHDANKFNPEHFAPEKEIHPYTYIPFSAGPRGCIGMKYAWITMKKVIPTLLLNYKFTTDIKYEDLRIAFNITTKLLNRDRLRVEKRIF